jgi:DNA-binding GntR family transcriptional regulator
MTPRPVSKAAQPARKQDSVYETLLARFASGAYRFGQPLLVKEIAEETGASKHPIMSALKELRAKGFVVITAQVGCEVISPGPTEIADFFVMFSRMEGVMVEFAATRRQPGETDRLAAINTQIAKLPRRDPASGERYRLLNREFHASIHQMGRSAALHERLIAHWAMSDFLISQSNEFARHLNEATAEHDEIIGAIARGSAAKARAAMENHILGFRLKVMENLAAHPRKAAPPRNSRAGRP